MYQQIMPGLGRDQGFSLVELLVGIVVGIIALAGALSIVVSSLVSGTSTVRAARLSQDLSGVMQMLTGDVRRAGYWGGAVGSSPYNRARPSFALDGDDCLLYAYDADGNGVAESDELFGFRLHANAVEMRIRGEDFTDCGDDANEWEPLTDPRLLTVTALSFVDGSRCLTRTGVEVACADASAFVKVRNLTVTVSGQLTDDPAVSKTLVESVRIRNDERLRAVRQAGR